MSSYYVRVPFAGYVGIEVEAETEDEAKGKAFELEARLDGDFDECEWELYSEITRGNVLYAPLNEIQVELNED
jgi:hypothetical protein